MIEFWTFKYSLLPIIRSLLLHAIKRVGLRARVGMGLSAREWNLKLKRKEKEMNWMGAKPKDSPGKTQKWIGDFPSFARLTGSAFISPTPRVRLCVVRENRRRRNGGWWSKGEEESGGVVRWPGCICFSPSSQGWQRFCPMVLSLSLSLDICFLYLVLYVTLLPLDGLLYLIDEDVIWVLGIRSEECKKDVPVALINMHSCTLDAKIKLNLGRSQIHICSL